MYLQKAARMNPEQREPSFSPPSALALSNMEEGMGQNIEKAQALQEDLSQRRASLQHHSAEAQVLQGQEALLADIIEEEMAHQTQVSVLSQLHLQQAEEIKSQSKEIRPLSTLLEKQQAILERVQEQQSRVPEVPVPLVDRIQELQREAFDILPGTVNAKRGAAAAHTSGISQDILVIGRTQFEDELAQGSHMECAPTSMHHVHFASNPQGRLTSTPLRHLEEDRSKARISPEVYSPGYGMKVAVQEFLETAQTKNQQTQGWIFSHCQLNLSVVAERYQCPHRGPELD